jgi:hypothetical protein
MKSFVVALLFGLSVLCATQYKVAWAEEAVNPISAIVVLDPKEIAAGEFQIGINFKIEPGWHLYWRYPGDTGLPTDVKFNLPPGASASDLQWPTPIKFVQAGGLVGIGYEGEVVLFSNLKIPLDLSSQEASILARWVACSSKICVPGRKEFVFKVGDLISHSGLESRDLSVWQKRVPAELAPDIGVVGSNFNFDNSNPKKSSHEIVFEWKTPVETVEWFPYLSRNLKIQNLKIESLDSKSVVTFDLDRLDEQAAANLSAEVVISHKGARRGFAHQILLK